MKEVWKGNSKRVLPAVRHTSLAAALLPMQDRAAVTRCHVGYFLREQMRGVHKLLRQKPISLLKMLGWRSISMASPTMRSIYRILVS
jgi:hypothetical protein